RRINPWRWLQPPGRRADHERRNFNQALQARAQSVNNEVQLLRSRILAIQMTAQEKGVNVQNAAGSLDPEIVLQRLHIPREQNVACALLSLDRDAPFIEGQHGIVAGPMMPFRE